MTAGGWALLFLLLMIMTAILGFFILTGVYAFAAKWLFVVFLIFFGVSLIKYLIS